MQRRQLTNAIGWFGVLSILAAYGFLSFHVLDADGAAYQMLNLIGATGLIIEAGTKKDMQPVVLNIIWAGVALIAIIRVILTST